MHKTWVTLLAGLAFLTANTSAQAEENKEMKALLDRAIKSQGGADKINKFKASITSMKGTVNVQNMKIDFTGDWSVQLPAQLRNKIDFQINGMDFSQVQVISKGKGWISLNGMTMEMPKDYLEEAREQLHSGFIVGQLTPLQDAKLYKLSPLGEIKIKDREAVGMMVSRKGCRDVNLYFDKKDGLLMKMETRGKDFATGGQEVTVEMFFGDYKEVQGTKQPYKLAIHHDGKEFLTGNVTNVQLLESLNEDVFAKP